MNFKLKFYRKLLSLITFVSILFQSFAPYLAVATPIYAQENVQQEVEEKTEEPQEEVTPTEEQTPTEEPEATPTTEEPTATPTEEILSTPTPVGEILDEAASIEKSATPTIASVTSEGEIETKVIETYQCFANSLNSCVVTDKDDYHPNEVVLLSGHGFIPNTSYILVITSETGPLSVNFDIMSDEQGSFEYSYQLDGTYRPDYSVFVYDIQDNLITQTSFTDTPSNPNAGLSVTICHATNSHQNPYQEISPSVDNFFNQGHDSHTGGVWAPGVPDHSWGDIIPQFNYYECPTDENAYGDDDTLPCTVGNGQNRKYADYILQTYPGMNIPAGQSILDNNCQIPGLVQTSTVTVCKQDESGAPLSGWRVGLLGSLKETINVPANGTVINRIYDPGSYALLAYGTYNYGNEQMIADPANSYRYASLICSGGVDGWVNGEVPSCMNNYLSLNFSTSGGPTAPGWGTYFNPEHEYLKAYLGGNLDLKIWDSCTTTGEGCYTDNEGSLDVEVYQGYVGDTGLDGCVVFDSVPYGSYELTEILQDGWQKVSGEGTKTIDSETESFVLVNREVSPEPSVTPTPTPEPYCGDGIINGSEQCDGVAGVAEGENFCTPTCKLVPLYNGAHSCPPNTTPVLFDEYTIPSTAAGGISVSGLTVGNHYLFEASGTYSYDYRNSAKLADAAYGTSTNWSSVRSDIGIWGTNRGVTSILGDLGQGMGVILWDEDSTFNNDHVYRKAYQAQATSAQFLISDWYSDWYVSSYNNQTAMSDNLDGLDLDVYECVPNPVIIKAHKIVCDSETDMPNWGDSASGVVNATSAENFVNSSNGKCRFVSDWDFEWGFDGEAPKPQPDFYGYSGAPWSSFDSKTTSSDPAILTINNLEGNTKIWFKEVLQSNYIPFTYYSGSGVGSNVSAEFYCHDDHYKYDNYEAISNPQYGQTYYCVAFNAPSTGIVQIHKFNDPNFNGQIDGNEAGIENWEFTLYNGSDCVSGSEVAGSTGLTDNKGDIDFENLPAGDYSVKETLQEGWDNSTNICQNVSVLVGQTSSLNFGNYELGKIIIDKVTTRENDSTDFQFTINAQDPTFGDKIFMLADQSLPEETWLKPGAYTVSETPDSNWNSRVECYTDETNLEENGQPDVRGFQLIPEVNAEDSIRVPVDPDAINLDPGETITCTFYNDYINSELTIQKFNNLWPVDQTAGAVINFTITVKASKNNVRGVRVIDLMPDGFSFNGSWQVTKNGTDITAQVPNPNYASPGEWDLGDMEKDDEIVITFPATISEDQDPGLYKDLAYAYGCQASYLSNTNGLLAARRIDNNLDTCEITDEEVILASSQDSGKTDDGVITEEFVGTQVNLVKDLQNSKSYEVEKEEEKIGEVLGASTMLPGTGADSLMTKLLWLFLAGSLMSLFFLLKHKSLKGLLVMLIALSISASSVMAATTPLTVRLEQPKSPTNDNTFNITYTTMDLQNREITAKCFKKGPTDAAYNQFGSTVNYIGGGSGNCVVNSSVMNNSGTYLFKVEVLAGLDSNSDSVTVDFGSSSLPETPVEYDKDKIEDCKYRIKGKSADDGKTVKVELYRSDDLEFKADAGSRVHTFNVGPNTSFELDNSVPHCDRDYYYALRAFDAYGNGSDLIGDRNIKVTFTESTTTETTTSETGALLVEGGANIAQEVVATEETTESEEAQIETEKTEESEKAEETGEGEVLGVKAAKTVWDRMLTFAKENPLTTVIIIGGLGILLYASVKAYKSGKKS